MKKYRFKGDPTDYVWNIELINGAEYDGRFELNGFISLEQTLISVKDQDENDWILKDWEEVTEPKNQKDTDLGYFAGLAMQGMLSNPESKFIGGTYEVSIASINLAKELIKQLDKECQ